MGNKAEKKRQEDLEKMTEHLDKALRLVEKAQKIAKRLDLTIKFDMPLDDSEDMRFWTHSSWCIYP